MAPRCILLCLAVLLPLGGCGFLNDAVWPALSGEGWEEATAPETSLEPVAAPEPPAPPPAVPEAALTDLAADLQSLGARVKQTREDYHRLGERIAAGLAAIDPDSIRDDTAWHTAQLEVSRLMRFETELARQSQTAAMSAARLVQLRRRLDTWQSAAQEAETEAALADLAERIADLNDRLAVLLDDIENKRRFLKTTLALLEARLDAIRPTIGGAAAQDKADTDPLAGREPALVIRAQASAAKVQAAIRRLVREADAAKADVRYQLAMATDEAAREEAQDVLARLNAAGVPTGRVDIIPDARIPDASIRIFLK